MSFLQLKKINLNGINQNVLAKIFLFLAICLFLLLSWRNPYSERSLVGNFDPFPDSLNYVVPIRNFIEGKGFLFFRETGQTKIYVPPVYSLTLLPTYLINFDVRSFYWTNLVLGLISVYLLFLISRKLTKSAWITGLVLFLYVTNFVIYWQTSLAMAENVLLPVVLLSIFLAISPLNKMNIIFSTIAATACYGSKYVAFPLTAVFLLHLIYRIWQKKKGKSFWRHIVSISLLATIFLFLFNGQQFVDYGLKFYQAVFIQDIQAQADTGWLSVQYLLSSFSSYSKAVMGWPIYNLWYVKPILPPLMAGFVYLWCVFMVWKVKRSRLLCSLLLALSLSQLSFLSMIAMIEGRYAFSFIPIVYIGLIAMLDYFKTISQKKLGSKKTHLLELFLIITLAFIISFFNFKSIKTQLLLNLKDGEKPWWQIGISASDRFMQSTQDQSSLRPMMISTMSPFLWDFYRQADYLVMPLTAQQHMINDPIWGIEFKPDQLLEFYQQELKNGRRIYLNTVGFNYYDWPIIDYYLEYNFNMILIQEDCLGACKLYELAL